MSNNGLETFEALKTYLIQNHNAKLASGGKEILKRCHFCGDSRNISDAHMYIGMKDTGVIVYNCFKCNAKGIVDGRFLRSMGCYDYSIMNLCEEQNRKYHASKEGQSYRSVTSITVQNLIIPPYIDEFTIKKLQYLSNRLGCIFNIYDAIRFKIILNLKSFLEANNITEYTRHPNVIEALDKFFIGFLSMDNKTVILRRLVPEGKLSKYIDFRYVNYSIFNSSNNINYESVKYYTIPNIVFPNKPPVNIHIAEGCFDILSIYLHVAPIGNNGVFVAINGKSYLALIRYLITNFGFMSCNLHLYADSDIALNKMLRIKDEVEPFNIPVFLHRNMATDQKDYGVSMDKIVDSYNKI